MDTHAHMHAHALFLVFKCHVRLYVVSYYKFHIILEVSVTFIARNVFVCVVSSLKCSIRTTWINSKWNLDCPKNTNKFSRNNVGRSARCMFVRSKCANNTWIRDSREGSLFYRQTCEIFSSRGQIPRLVSQADCNDTQFV